MTAIAAVLGTAVGLHGAQRHAAVEDALLAFTAGGFLYLATVTMLPDLVRQSSSLPQIAAELLCFVLGVAMMVLVALYE